MSLSSFYAFQNSWKCVWQRHGCVCALLPCAATYVDFQYVVLSGHVIERAQGCQVLDKFPIGPTTTACAAGHVPQSRTRVAQRSRVSPRHVVCRARARFFCFPGNNPCFFYIPCAITYTRAGTRVYVTSGFCGLVGGYTAT